MKENEKEPVDLPENAFRELEEGEEYNPIMSPGREYREVTPWSVSWGIVMAVLFSAAAAYLGLKVGQVFEAAIPIAIIAVGLSTGFKRKNALGENVIIQSIGACSGTVVAGDANSSSRFMGFGLFSVFIRVPPCCFSGKKRPCKSAKGSAWSDLSVQVSKCWSRPKGRKTPGLDTLT